MDLNSCDSLKRRKGIIKRHPEVRKLLGPDIRTFYIGLLLIFIHFVSAYIMQFQNTYIIIIASICFGGLISQSIALLIHETSHNLVFKSKRYNFYFNLFANLLQVIPVATTFRHYHMRHHQYHTQYPIDVDIATTTEAKIFKGKFGKFMWLALQPFVYSMRPLIIQPRKLSKGQLINISTQLIFVVSALYLFNIKFLIYLLLSLYFGASFHPIAGHFIAEHLNFFDCDQETFSYYGPLNFIAFNVGYHREHHDFPAVSWTNLPKLKKIAPEFYSEQYSYSSWSKVLFDFVFKPKLHVRRRKIIRL